MKNSELYKSFLRSMEETRLYRQGEKILLAVSGGIDSMVMMHLYYEAGIDCEVAHCNFQLRGEDSEKDELFVREESARRDLNFHIRHFDVGERMKKDGVSLQMAARDLRYEWFNELCNSPGFDAVATAHNLNDSIETFLLNLGRGTGIRGLTGIPLRNDKIIRPLLFAGRKEIEAYAKQSKLDFREDASNRETRYQRNKIRHDVIPVMEQINPSFLASMSDNMRRMQEYREIMEERLREIKDHTFLPQGEEFHIPVKKVLDLKPLSTWLYELFSPYGFTRLQCKGLEVLMRSSASGKRFISPTHQLYKDRGHLILLPSANTGADPDRRYYLDAPGQTSILPFAMDMEILNSPELGKIPADRHIACLDMEYLQFPLIIRHWQHGDYFYPLGMDQMKKLSDFFVDEKIPLPEKEKIWILASGKKIVWIMGIRIDHRFRITDDTSKILKLSLQADIAP